MAETMFKVHPIANLYPDMQGEEYEAFKADIERSGVQRPIRGRYAEEKARDGSVVTVFWVYDGKNRLRACNELGIVPPVEDVDKSEAEFLAEAESANLTRRHLNPGQRAVIVVQNERLEHKYTGAKPKYQDDDGKTLDRGDILARRASCARPYIFMADKLVGDKRFKDLLEAVRDGTKYLKDAAREADQMNAALAAKDDDGEGDGDGDGEGDGEVKEKKDKADPVDGFGNPVPKRFHEAFAERDKFGGAIAALRQMKPVVKTQLADGPGGSYLDGGDAAKAIEDVAAVLRDSQPHAVCLACKGRPVDCDGCRSLGWVNKPTYDAQDKARKQKDAEKEARRQAKLAKTEAEAEAAQEGEPADQPAA